MVSRRNKYLLVLSICLVFLASTFHYREEIPELSHDSAPKLQDNEASPPQPPPTSTKDAKYKYKPQPTILPDPIVDNFPLAAAAKSAKDLPPIPSWNRPPDKHVPEKTPLFIGFTRNWRLLQQVVVSYITAGWPPEDIYVVENTGVMDSNAKSLLSLQNPFFLNHTRLHLLGVNILVTPTLLSFAQLQNYYIWHSIERDWKQFFWGHMDIVALAFEDKYADEQEKAGTVSSAVSDTKNDYSDFKSLYRLCVDSLKDATAKDEKTGQDKNWALRFFFYDKLALVNVAAFVGIGAWDTHIPFYMTDCDMHARLSMAGLEITETPAGWLIDVASSLDDLYSLYRKVDSPPASFIDPQIFENKVQEAAEGKIDSREANPLPEAEAVAKADPEKPKDHSKEAWFEYLTGSDASSKWRSPDDTMNSASYIHLKSTLEAMQHSKATSSRGRNTWQSRQRGGEGDPFYRDSAGFEEGIQMTIEHGRRVFSEKWGHRDCDIRESGLRPEDAWKVEHDW